MAQAQIGLAASGTSFVGSTLTLILGFIFLILVLVDISLKWDECTFVGQEARRLSSLHVAFDHANRWDVHDVDYDGDDDGHGDGYWDFEADEGESESVADIGRRLVEVDYDAGYMAHTDEGKGKGGDDGKGGKGDDDGGGGGGKGDVDGKTDGNGKGSGGAQNVYTAYGAGGCNWEWRSVFSFVPPIFLIIWLPLIMGFLGMAVHFEKLRINWIIDILTPGSYLTYGFFMLITAFYANFGYCGKMGVILGFFNCLAALLCFVARGMGETSIANISSLQK